MTCFLTHCTWCTSLCLPIHLVKRHFGCFQVLAATNKIAVSNHLLVFMWTRFHLPKINTQECNFWIVWQSQYFFKRKCSTVLMSSCIILQFHLRCLRLFFHILTSICIATMLYFSCSHKYVVTSVFSSVNVLSSILSTF